MTRALLSSTCLALALAACGGGDNSVPTPPFPSPEAMLNEGNMLDAAAVAYVGNAHNWADYAVLYDDLFSLHLVQTEPGVHACPRGGSVSLSRQGLLWSYAVSNCRTARLTIGSGTFEVDASQQSATGQLHVRFDQLQLLKLWALAPDLRFSGSYHHDLAAGGEASQHIPEATLSVLSPVSTRQYTSISRTTAASRYRVQSSAFPVVLNVVIGAGYGDDFVASADDGTTITVSTVATGRKIELRARPQTSPQVVRLYTDGEFRAAIQRATP